jgi:hypothetical protein
VVGGRERPARHRDAADHHRAHGDDPWPIRRGARRRRIMNSPNVPASSRPPCMR